MDMAPWKRGYTDGDSVVVIINPNTRADAMQVRAALGQWVPEGVSLKIVETKRDVSTFDIAREAVKSADGVIACGGDGTVSEVAAALIERRTPLGIIPGGSTNIIAQELGIPSNIGAAAALAFGPFDVHEMDLGVCNGKYFLHMGGSGLDSLTFEATDEGLKRKIGWMAYVPAALKALREKPATFQIEVDEEEFTVDSPLVLVANGASIINSSFRLDDSIRSNDGYLDVFIVTATKPHELAMVIAQVANPMAALADSQWVIHRKAKSIRIDSDEQHPIQLDGDVMTETPATFGISPVSLGVAIPGPKR